MYLANNKWLKYVKMILVTAEEFGYGPIITAIYFLEQVNNYKHIECVFAGKGLSLVQAKKSDLFVECAECDLKDNDQIINFLNNRSDINTIISFENLESIIVGVHKHLKTIYIDNLFWMWKSIPEELNIGKNNFCVSNNEYIGHIDSLDFVKILLEIEMKYNVEFQEEDLIRSNYCYLDNLVDTVKKMVNNDDI